MLTDRKVRVLDLPLRATESGLTVKSVVVRFPGVGTFDLGALCYLERSNRHRRMPNDCRAVDLASFDQERAEQIARLLSYISDLVSSATGRARSILRQVRGWCQFLDWCDANSLPRVLNDEAQARRACKGYLEMLYHRLRTNEITQNTARHYQQEMLVLVRDFLGLNDIFTGLRLISANYGSVEHTEPPCEDAQGRYLALVQSLFDGLTDLVVDSRPFPYRLRSPKYLREVEEQLWVFPGSPWIMAAHNRRVREQLSNSTWAIDYESGEVRHENEIVDKYGNIYEARKAVVGARRQIEKANANPHHLSRRRAAVRAQNAFIMLFLANTGMNWQQLAELRWNDEFVVEKRSALFRTIKYRASNKTVSFSIRSAFLKEFRKFIKLRNYLLADNPSHKFLFVRTDMMAQPRSTPVDCNLIYRFNNLLKSIDPELQTITARAWRAAKGDWLIRTTDRSVTAIQLQNSDATVDRSYSLGSESRANVELEEFLSRVEDKVLSARNSASARDRSSQIGHCTNFGSPTAEGQPTVFPDCRQPEGCLFCRHYVVHADDRDIRKLMSLEYCIASTAHLSASAEHHERVFGPVLHRTRAIIEHIERKSKKHGEMVSRVRGEVFEYGELDPYWASKMEMMEYLGVVVSATT